MKTLMLTAIVALLFTETAAAQHVVDAYGGLTGVSYEEVGVVTPEFARALRTPSPITSGSEQFVGAALAALVGGGLGAFGGYYLAGATNSLEGLLYVVYTGHLVGAAAGATMVTGDAGNSFLGSLAGGALGFVFASMGDDAGLLYLVVHSVTTALVATR